MAVRTGMQNLIDRVRSLSGAGTAEYTSGTVVYWTDQHLQDILDGNYLTIIDHSLIWMPQVGAGGTAKFYLAQARYGDLEEAASGTARWAIRDTSGNFIGTALYTPNYRSGLISWGTVDQQGTAYFLSGYSFDVHAAAADVWMQRIAEFNNWYQFSADNQSFNRQQAWEHAIKAVSLLRGKTGSNVLGASSGDLHVSLFYRTDLNA